MFPYQVARSYYGSPTGGTVTAIAEPVATSFVGGPFKTDASGGVAVNSANGDVTLTWSAVEGGIYRIEAKGDLAATWSTIAPSITVAGDDTGGIIETGGATGHPRRFYRTVRTGISAFDNVGFAGTVVSVSGPVGGGPNTVLPNNGARGTVVSVVIELDPALTPNLPPANIVVFSVTTSGTGITASNISRPSQTLVLATFTR